MERDDPHRDRAGEAWPHLDIWALNYAARHGCPVTWTQPRMALGGDTTAQLLAARSAYGAPFPLLVGGQTQHWTCVLG